MISCLLKLSLHKLRVEYLTYKSGREHEADKEEEKKQQAERMLKKEKNQSKEVDKTQTALK